MPRLISRPTVVSIHLSDLTHNNRSTVELTTNPLESVVTHHTMRVTYIATFVIALFAACGDIGVAQWPSVYPHGTAPSVVTAAILPCLIGEFSFNALVILAVFMKVHVAPVWYNRSCACFLPLSSATCSSRFETHGPLPRFPPGQCCI